MRLCLLPLLFGLSIVLQSCGQPVQKDLSQSKVRKVRSKAVPRAITSGADLNSALETNLENSESGRSSDSEFFESNIEPERSSDSIRLIDDANSIDDKLLND